jgi:hypothetical protein
MAIGVDAGDKAAAEARDPRMELSACDAAMVLCRAATERVKVTGALTRETSIAFTFGRRVAPASGSHRRKRVIMTELAEGPPMSE